MDLHPHCSPQSNSFFIFSTRTVFLPSSIYCLPTPLGFIVLLRVSKDLIIYFGSYFHSFYPNTPQCSCLGSTHNYQLKHLYHSMGSNIFIFIYISINTNPKRESTLEFVVLTLVKVGIRITMAISNNNRLSTMNTKKNTVL